MWSRARLWIIVGIAGVGIASAAAAKPRIVILATGGTIAGAQADTSQAGYEAGKFKIEDLINAVPRMGELADLSGEQVVNIGSQTMTNDVWLKLAVRANEVLRRSDVDGVVVTHGTDTLEETGYFLDLVLKSDKPVVLVGSMRPATAISADGPANLYDGVAVAANPEARGRGVLAVLNNEIHYAREVEKRNTTQLDTFESPNRGRAGVVNTGQAIFFARPTPKHTTETEFAVEANTRLPRVDIIYSYANLGADVVDAAVKQGARGIVLAGVGDGNTTDAALAALAAAAQAGVAVVRSSRTGSGFVVRNMELDDDKLGLIAAMDLNPQKARVLLMLGLLQTTDPQRLQEMFYRY
jgi:L-asparaginase